MTIRYDRDNALPYTVLETRREANGRSRSLIKCPHCGSSFWAFWWSISGGGKKCEGCGAMHNSTGVAARVISNR